MSAQFWSEALVWATTDGAVVQNTTTETIIAPDVTVPANYMREGRLLHLWAFGKYGTTGTPTMIFSLRWGGVAGTLLSKTAACTTPSGVTNACWEVDVYIQCRSSGQSGTIMANGHCELYAAVAGTVATATGEGLLTPMTVGGVTGPATASVDTTVDKALSLTLTWSAASASNTATMLNYVLKSMN